MKYSNTKCTQNTLKKINDINFIDIISDSNIKPIIEEFLPNYRERIFTPTITLSIFLKQAFSPISSCTNAVNNFIVETKEKFSKKVSNSTGSYCRSRQKLPIEMIQALTKYTGMQVKSNLEKEYDIKGNIYLIDGTTFSLPDTEKNQAKYPQQKAQAEGLGFPICRALGVFCLESGVAINAELAPFKGKDASEHHMLRKLLDTFQSGDLIVGDALYSSFWLIEYFQRHNIDFVFQQNGQRSKKSDFTTGEQLGKNDHIIEYKKPQRPDWMSVEKYESIPKIIKVRELKEQHKILVTSYNDINKYPSEKINEIYKRRWNIELDFRNLKTTMSLSQLSCKTPEMCEKEIWMYLLANNIIRIFMMQASINFKIKARTISFKCTLQLWNKILDSFEKPLEVITNFLYLMTRNRVGNRPGRIEPRAKKRRSSAYTLLMVPREVARENIRKNGHPPKQRKNTGERGGKA